MSKRFARYCRLRGSRLQYLRLMEYHVSQNGGTSHVLLLLDRNKETRKNSPELVAIAVAGCHIPPQSRPSPLEVCACWRRLTRAGTLLTSRTKSHIQLRVRERGSSECHERGKRAWEKYNWGISTGENRGLNAAQDLVSRVAGNTRRYLVATGIGLFAFMTRPTLTSTR